MKCPHCLTDFHDNIAVRILTRDVDGMWGVKTTTCPTCGRGIYYLFSADTIASVGGPQISIIGDRRDDMLIRPKGINRAPIPGVVTGGVAEDYKEACLVLTDSPKASAALSRRCLQSILREKAGVKKGDLANEIQLVLESDKLPSHIADSIDAVRNIGNFAAHPGKSSATGEIVSVEPGEAEWNLEVIEMLFDFYYVQPEKTRLRKEALNAKLKDAGKPDMK